MITFWIRGDIAVDRSIVDLHVPNSWLGIPLGRHQERIPLKNISGVKRSTYISVIELLVGALLTILTLGDILSARASWLGILLFFVSLILILDSFKVMLNIEKSGTWVVLPFACFEGKKAAQILDVLTQAIYQDTDKTDLGMYFDPKQQPPTA